MSALSGRCYRCRALGLLYRVFSKKLQQQVGVCYECREFIKKAAQL
jgi:hypothetical protein